VLDGAGEALLAKLLVAGFGKQHSRRYEGYCDGSGRADLGRVKSANAQKPGGVVRLRLEKFWTEIRIVSHQNEGYRQPTNAKTADGTCFWGRRSGKLAMTNPSPKVLAGAYRLPALRVASQVSGRSFAFALARRCPSGLRDRTPRLRLVSPGGVNLTRR
jgi:hypothetical protein